MITINKMNKTTNKKFKGFYIVCGYSGSGKSTIVDKLCKRLGMTEILSYTTRQPRYLGENTHTFINEEEAKKLTGIIAETNFCGNYYCTTEEQVKNNDIVIWDIKGIKDFKTYCFYKNIYIPHKVIFISTARSTAIRRIVQRGDGMDEAMNRAYHDIQAFSEVERYADMTIINNEHINDAVDRIIKYISTWENRFAKQEAGIMCKNDVDLDCLYCWHGYDDDGGIYCELDN